LKVVLIRQTFCWDRNFHWIGPWICPGVSHFLLFGSTFEIFQLRLKDDRIFSNEPALFHPLDALGFFIENHEITLFEAAIALSSSG